MPQLQRQFAYDRLLERLYRLDPDWIVKGATALLARDIGNRGTIDIDIFRAQPTDGAVADLRHAVARDIGDWFRFELGKTRSTTDAAIGVRLPVTCYIGGTVWMRYHIDLVGAGLRMTGKPEDVPPMVAIDIPDVSQHGYRVYPLVDHIADKFAAMFETYGALRRPSTRFKDLIDIVALVTSVKVSAGGIRTALASEAMRRGLVMPTRFDVPDRDLWKPGYEAEAKRSALPFAGTLDEALEVVRPFVDPILDGTAVGNWDPTLRKWVN